MTTTDVQIARRGSAAARGLTLERYVETMMPRYGSNSVKRWTRRGHYALEREDLLSEAALVLTEIWNKYAHVKPEGELRRMGTRGFFNHIGNLFHHTRAYGAKDAHIVYPDARTSDEGFGYRGRGADPVDVAFLKRHGRVEPQLESLVAREDLERLPVPDFRGPSADAVRKIFSAACRAVREDDGYSLVEAAEKLNYNQRGEVRMNGGATVTGPQEPDVQREAALADIESAKAVVAKAKTAAKVARAPESEKAQTGKAAKAGAARASAADAEARAASFKKGQRVKYKGGGRTSLKAGAAMTVLGSVKSKGRMYLRCRTVVDGQNVTLSGELVSKV